MTEEVSEARFIGFFADGRERGTPSRTWQRRLEQVQTAATISAVSDDTASALPEGSAQTSAVRVAGGRNRLRHAGQRRRSGHPFRSRHVGTMRVVRIIRTCLDELRRQRAQQTTLVPA
jgi:hypothetical protein